MNNVYFQDLIADFSISAVQDDDVHLPEIHEVPLEDLWPTIDQENSELNIERTADCIDELRLVSYNFICTNRNAIIENKVKPILNATKVSNTFFIQVFLSQCLDAMG